MNLRFVCAQPAITYYTWQVEVMINNFIDKGVNPNNIDIVCWKVNGIIPNEWRKLAETYSSVRFFFYDDIRTTRHYISSIRPNILKQHFRQHPYLRDEVIFYHDCDIIFTKPISEWITDEIINDNNWYGSDTNSYISYDYIDSKKYYIIDRMCQIVGINKELVKANNNNSIGAQYIMKNIDHTFWEKVERDSENLFFEISHLNKIASDAEEEVWKKEKEEWELQNSEKPFSKQKYNPLQIWCADMWAVLWNGWMRGNETICHPNLEFSWGTDSEEKYKRCNIMHNAGVVSNADGFFYKFDYRESLPYGVTLNLKENSASDYYFREVKKTGEKSCLI
jgi:hypothetical protein